MSFLCASKCPCLSHTPLYIHAGKHILNLFNRPSNRAANKILPQDIFSSGFKIIAAPGDFWFRNAGDAEYKAILFLFCWGLSLWTRLYILIFHLWSCSPGEVSLLVGAVSWVISMPVRKRETDASELLVLSVSVKRSLASVLHLLVIFIAHPLLLHRLDHAHL